MKVRFIRLTPEALVSRALIPQTPVAVFNAEGAGECTVLAEHVSPFLDIDFLHWHARAREVLLTALCSEVRQAGWWDESARLLALHQRFRVEPDRDSPAWVLNGFNSIQNVDLHLIKHVLGLGGDSVAVARWSALLGLELRTDLLLDQLENLGCIEWRKMAEGPAPEVERPIFMYRKLSPLARASCIRLLALARERYMELASDVVRQTGSSRHARHIHLGPNHSPVMHFLADTGVTVIAKGECEGLAISTAFSALAEHETALGPVTLKRRWVRILNDPSAVSGNLKVHSPSAWGVST